MKTVLETYNLRKTYMQGSIPVHALRGIDLEIKQGELIAILGPSGSGKSTLLNMLGALDKPTEGGVIINGKDTAKLTNNELAELRRSIGFVFQYFNLVPRFTAFKNVDLAMSVQNIPRKKRKQQAKEILALVGLKDRIFHKNTELSGGQQQRVAIARALAQNPQFLLMDEPTGNVDTKTRNMIIQLIKELNQKQGITVIIITHDVAIAQHCNRIIHLVDGEIVQDSPQVPDSQLISPIID
jgi:putative ABC transport system ATP-binding protein